MPGAGRHGFIYVDDWGWLGWRKLFNTPASYVQNLACDCKNSGPHAGIYSDAGNYTDMDLTGEIDTTPEQDAEILEMLQSRQGKATWYDLKHTDCNSYADLTFDQIRKKYPGQKVVIKPDPRPDAPPVEPGEPK